MMSLDDPSTFKNSGAELMAHRSFDSRCEATFARQAILTAFMVCGFFLTGCGGSSESPVATTDSAGGAEVSDSAMNGESMMSGSPGMNDPSMSESMNEGASEEFGDTSAGHGGGGPESAEMMTEMMAANGEAGEFGDTSAGHGEGGSESAEMMAEAMAANGEAGEFGDTSAGHGEDGADSAAMAAAMAANGEAGKFGDTSAGHGEEGVDAAEMTEQMAAEMAARGAGTPGDESAISVEMAANGGFPGSAEGEFGPGSEGAGPGGPNGGGGQAKEPPADSPDYPAFKLVLGLMQGKHDGLKDYVSTRGRGLIEKIRGGSLTTEEKNDLKKTFAQPQLVGIPRTIRGSRTVTLNSAGQIITLVSKKQGSAWKVSSISIRAAKRR